MRVSNEEAARRIRVKEAAENISSDLNLLEDICTNYSIQEQKEEKMTQIGLLVGKTISTFCTLCDYLGIFDEDGIYANVDKEDWVWVHRQSN